METLSFLIALKFLGATLFVINQFFELSKNIKLFRGL